VVVGGGGFAGAPAAVQLVRRSTAPLAITIVAPRARVGPGLAYSTRDSDHRLNAPTGTHSIDPEDAAHFTRWCEATGVFERDPEALIPNGAAFVRRSDFGDYVEATLRAHAAWPATGSTIEPVRERAVGVSVEASDSERSGSESFVVLTESGRRLRASLLIVATGNPAPRLPAFFAPALLGHPGVVADPLQSDGVSRLDADARVLVVGSGLTALDIVSTLLRRGHRGAIEVVSRRGLRPRGHGPALEAPAADAAPERPLDRILAPVAPAWAVDAADPPTALGALRRMRRRVREVQAQGQSWHAAFDELRECVWQVWPQWPAAEKRRFLQALRPWYDVHRFRAPPQNDALVRAAEAAGQVAFRAARVRAIEGAQDGALRVRLAAPGARHDEVERFDAVVNCSGLDVGAGAAANPFLRALVEQGRLLPDPSGIGFAVDAQCRAIDAHGRAQPGLRVFGPPTAGSFGDPVAVVFIATQIRRVLPELLAQLARASDPAHPAA
jgi:uncharacterized NAD(P)/FAD-binding protein YdhS